MKCLLLWKQPTKHTARFSSPGWGERPGLLSPPHLEDTFPLLLWTSGCICCIVHSWGGNVCHLPVREEVEDVQSTGHCPPASFLDLGVCGEREDVEAGTTIVQLTKPPTLTALEAEADAIGPGRGSEASFLGLSWWGRLASWGFWLPALSWLGLSWTMAGYIPRARAEATPISPKKPISKTLKQ